MFLPSLPSLPHLCSPILSLSIYIYIYSYNFLSNTFIYIYVRQHNIRVFDPSARRYQNQTLSQTYITNEKEKKRGYNERVLQVENGTFTPLVFSVHGGMGPECKTFFKRLASLLSEKRNENLAAVSTWVRTRISFALLRSALVCPALVVRATTAIAQMLLTLTWNWT